MLADTEKNIKFIQGNQACAEAALAAGVRFYAGYPITPSSEIAEILSKRLPEIGGKFIQMEDEIASMGAILGASLTGLKAMTATSGPGFSLKQELIGFACLCEIPCVIVNVQRGGPSTGLPTSPAQADVMQARWGTHGDHSIIVLCPSSVRDMYDLTVYAINLSESLRTPVILLSDEIVAHMYEKIELPDACGLKLLERPRPQKDPGDKYLPYYTSQPREVPRIANFGEGFRFNVTGLIHDTDGFPTTSPEKTEALLNRLHKKIDSRLEEICLIETEEMEDASMVLCSYGASARSSACAVKEARKMGIKVGLLTLKTLWPFGDFIFERLNPRVKTVIVCEMNLGQIVKEVERASRGRFEVIGINISRGTLITPQEIIKKIEGLSRS
ncbi:MAG: 2-oxoacid:acceptor oxidoreductase subunit alpha [Candidatus Omnitrophota bacterium]|nr:2-oxoacid:acceptor oxidoreductase subunit alpha [Candidatus Omnitrophota bacterium]